MLYELDIYNSSMIFSPTQPQYKVTSPTYLKPIDRFFLFLIKLLRVENKEREREKK